MKKIQILLACTLIIALAGLTTLRAVEAGQKEGKATVKSVHGTVQYLENGKWLPVHVNMKFGAGVTIRTVGNSQADISVNGVSSVVRMTNATTLQIPTMSYVGSVREGDTTTLLNLMSGSVLGNVKKISANSRYEIVTPHGVAGIRGTDFQVEAVPTQDGKFDVTFNSITGIITVSAVINGTLVTHTLTTGTSWEIGESPRQMKAEILTDFQSQILGLVQATVSGINTGLPPGGNGNNNNNNNGNTPGPGTLNPFPGGAPTGQPQAPAGVPAS